MKHAISTGHGRAVSSWISEFPYFPCDVIVVVIREYRWRTIIRDSSALPSFLSYHRDDINDNGHYRWFRVRSIEYRIPLFCSFSLPPRGRCIITCIRNKSVHEAVCKSPSTIIILSDHLIDHEYVGRRRATKGVAMCARELARDLWPNGNYKDGSNYNSSWARGIHLARPRPRTHFRDCNVQAELNHGYGEWCEKFRQPPLKKHPGIVFPPSSISPVRIFRRLPRRVPRGKVEITKHGSGTGKGGEVTSRAMKADVVDVAEIRGENSAHPSSIVTVTLIFATDGQLIAISRISRKHGTTSALMTREGELPRSMKARRTRHRKYVSRTLSTVTGDRDNPGRKVSRRNWSPSSVRWLGFIKQ